MKFSGITEQPILLALVRNVQARMTSDLWCVICLQETNFQSNSVKSFCISVSVDEISAYASIFLVSSSACGSSHVC